MNLFGHDLYFWAAVLGAAIVKIMTSERHSFWRSVVMVIVAVFAAWVFTRPVLIFFDMPAETYEVPMAAVIALTGENLVRWLISLTPRELLKLLREWRGR